MTRHSWPTRHFSLTDALDARPDDLPHLLRRMAQHIEELGFDAMEIDDLVVRPEICEDGPWWSMTSYWRSDDPASG